MADASTILDLRRIIDAPDNVEPWTDTYLSSRIDAWPGDLTSLGAVLWREEAARYTRLIDIQEGSSNRKLSQLQTQALKMAESLGGAVVGSGTKRSRTRKIERQ